MKKCVWIPLCVLSFVFTQASMMSATARAEDLSKTATAAPQLDPDEEVAGIEAARKRVNGELETKRTAQRRLGEQTSKLAAECRRIAGLRDDAYRLACRLRDRFLANEYPVVEQGQSFPDALALREQISLLLTEVDQYDSTLVKVRQAYEEVRRHREELVASIDDLESRDREAIARREQWVAERAPRDGTVLLEKISQRSPERFRKPTVNDAKLARFLQGDEGSNELAPTLPGKSISRTPRASSKPIFVQDQY